MKKQAVFTIRQAGNPGAMSIAARVTRYIEGIIWSDVGQTWGDLVVTYDDSRVSPPGIIDRILRATGLICEGFFPMALTEAPAAC